MRKDGARATRTLPYRPQESRFQRKIIPTTARGPHRPIRKASRATQPASRSPRRLRIKPPAFGIVLRIRPYAPAAIARPLMIDARRSANGIEPSVLRGLDFVDNRRSVIGDD